jgi:hypothetical protein
MARQAPNRANPLTERDDPKLIASRILNVEDKRATPSTASADPNRATLRIDKAAPKLLI